MNDCDSLSSKNTSKFIRDTNLVVSGFLPPTVPGLDLPEFMSDYSYAIKELPDYFSVGKSGVRNWLDGLFSEFNPEINVRLSILSIGMKREALTILAILAQSYRWNKCPPDSIEYNREEIKFPEGILKPWNFLSKNFNLPATNTYYSVIASNWTLKDKNAGDPYSATDINPDNLSLLYSWLKAPYSEQLAHFLLSFVELELFGKKIILAIEDCYRAVEHHDLDLLKTNILEIYTAIKGINKSFARRIRTRNILVKDWKEIIHIPFGWGLISNGQKMEGASGMQVGSIAILNSFFDIPSRSSIGKATLNSRHYLLPEQRMFLEMLDNSPNIGQFIKNSADNEILDIYNDCIASLVRWRVSHQKRGKLYLSHSSKGKPQMATGLTLDDSGKDIADIFHDDMQERINETNEVKLINE